jgi:Gram-negative bacterial TonB protein C-terminal
MNLHEDHRARANFAGLASRLQQAEMKLILDGRWPPLKPLPVFKYETDEYRASIEFDKMRGEWVCRKISLQSNKVHELRGVLAPITLALPHGQAEVIAEFASPQRLGQELEKDTTRRLQAVLEWRENYENGALYSGLRDFLTKSQQAEIDESIRLTLTARQLQCSPKNISYVFDALLKSGGKLATLIEIARRNKTRQGAVTPAQTEEDAVAPEPERPALVESFIPATTEIFSEEPIQNVLLEQGLTASFERIAHAEFQSSEVLAPEVLDLDLPPLVEDLQNNVHHPSSVSGFGSRVRRPKFESSPGRTESAPSRKYVVEISGLQVAAVAFGTFIVVVVLTLGLTEGRGPLVRSLWNAQKSMPTADATPPAVSNQPVETAPRPSTQEASNTILDPDNSAGANKLKDAIPSEDKISGSSWGSESSKGAAPAESNSSPKIEFKPSADSEESTARKDSAGLITPSIANPQPAHSPVGVSPKSGAQSGPAPRKQTPAMGAVQHASSRSAMLVRVPAHGGKPFRVSFPEEPIAASSSIAMTSELSILVSPQRGPAADHKPSRLQAGELVYFVWPRYSKADNRYGSAETVKVRINIGQLGQVQDVKLVSGSISLLPATVSAIRQWRYKPTLLNKRPVPAQQEVTIEFRPPQYLSQVRTMHPSQK